MSHLFTVYLLTPAKKIAKFKEWLGIGTNIDIKASTAVIEILSNLAYETVNEVSVMVRLEKNTILTS